MRLALCVISFLLPPAIVSAGCGGIVLDLGPNDGGLGPNDGGPDSPGPLDTGPSSESGTLATDGYLTLPNPDVGGVCQGVAGMNANDVWCIRDNNLKHWDGIRWTAVTVPLPTGTGGTTDWGITPAGPNELWLATSYGMAHVRASGAPEDVTAQFPPLSGYVPTVTKAGGHVFLGWPIGKDGVTVYSHDGSQFVPLAVQDPTCADATPEFATVDGTFWAYCSGNQLVRNDGAQWTSVPTDTNPENQMITRRDYWSMRDLSGQEQAIYCPDWCHAGSPPFGQATTRDWSLVQVKGSDPTTAVKVQIGPPPDIPHDGSVKYEGRMIRASASDGLATIGCETPKPGTGREHVVIHEWDGQNYGPGRALPDSVACPEIWGNPRPLDDGTWVFSACLSCEDTSITLVRP